jgi:hypothetical protein
MAEARESISLEPPELVTSKPVILRHDLDLDPLAARAIFEFEALVHSLQTSVRSSGSARIEGDCFARKTATANKTIVK